MTAQTSHHTVRPDHLIVAATNLAAGIRYVENLLGVPLEIGGQHLTMGTHNALLHLGENFYLEVIAIDPTLPAPQRPRWFGLDEPAIRARLEKTPQLLHWVVRTTNIETVTQGNPAPYGPVISMKRGNLSWKITVPEDGTLPGGGIFPSMIQWQTNRHPATALPDRGCSLMELVLGTPEPEAFKKELQTIDSELRFTIRKSPTPTLFAQIKTPSGIHLLG